MGAIDVVRLDGGTKVRDVTVEASDAEHVERIVAGVRAVPRIAVERVSDRTFLLHLGGKLERSSSEDTLTICAIAAPMIVDVSTPRSITRSAQSLRWKRGRIVEKSPTLRLRQSLGDDQAVRFTVRDGRERCL